ncbi:MAG TPA: hypothetical protein VLJ58_03950 [Ramlibacter sp.]|nr:hypothetical protein [Ramlibacter sp.]
MYSKSPMPQGPVNVARSYHDALAAQPWMTGDDELMLGCECANPALQIDSWTAEADAPAAPPSR